MPQSSIGRSMPCNGRLISQTRKQLGWTQMELARKAGFTERLIVKAEGSQNIATSTLHVIAATLCEAGAAISVEDLSADPAALAREFFRSTYFHGPRSLEVNAHFISPKLVIHFAGDPAVFPFAGTHVGIDAAKRAMQLFYSVIQPPSDPSEMDHLIQIVSTGHGALVWGSTWAHPIGMPMKEPMKFAIKMDFEKGLMTVLEGSQNIAVSTLHIISATFCEAGATVTAADLSSNPAALAREFIRAMYQHGPNVIDVNRRFLDTSR